MALVVGAAFTMAALIDVTLRGGGSAARISNGTEPQDPGGGDAQLTTSQDMAVMRPWFHRASRLVAVRSDGVGVSAVTVDATRRRVDCALSTSLMSVVAEEF